MDSLPTEFVNNVCRLLRKVSSAIEYSNLDTLRTIPSTWAPISKKASKKTVCLQFYFCTENKQTYFICGYVEWNSLRTDPSKMNEYEIEHIGFWRNKSLPSFMEAYFLDHQNLNLIAKILKQSAYPMSLDMSDKFENFPPNLMALIQVSPRIEQMSFYSRCKVGQKLLVERILRGTLKTLLVTNVFVDEDVLKILENWIKSNNFERLYFNISKDSPIKPQEAIEAVLKIAWFKKDVVKVAIAKDVQEKYPGFVFDNSFNYDSNTVKLRMK